MDRFDKIILMVFVCFLLLFSIGSYIFIKNINNTAECHNKIAKKTCIENNMSFVQWEGNRKIICANLILREPKVLTLFKEELEGCNTKGGE